MFFINENGELEYAGNTDDNDASLFANGDMDLYTFESSEVDPSDQSPVTFGVDDGSIGTVSGGDIIPSVTNIENYNAITVYAVPSAAAGYPNSSSLSYLEDIVSGYPLHYKYLSFRTDDQYAQSMVLYVAPVASIEGSTVTLEDCDVVNLDYIRDTGSYTNYLDRTDSHEDSVTLDIPTGSLVYTNIVPGYGTFQTTIEETAGTNHLTFILIGAAALFVIQRLLGGARHD